MALTGTFLADFTSFVTAVEQSEAKLRDFESGAGKVESALNRMVDSFSGRQVIQDATLMAEAVDRIGGVSKLTETELANVGARAQEAADKLRAMGQDVPPKIQAIADAAKNASKGFGEFLGGLNIQDTIQHPLDTATEAAKAFATSLGPVGLGLTAAVTAGGLFGEQLLKFAEQAGQVGGSLNDMSEKTGIAVPALSNLSAAAQIGGSSLDQVSNAIFLMQRNMVEGGPKVEAGFQRIGLSIGEIRRLSPDQQFLAIAEGLKQISDPAERAAATMEIFGRQGRDLLPLLSKDLQALVEESEKLGLTWTEQDAKAAEEFEMQSRALDLTLQKVKTTIGSDLIPLLTVGLTYAKGSIGWFLTESPISRVAEDVRFFNVILEASKDKLGAVGGALASGNFAQAAAFLLGQFETIKIKAPEAFGVVDNSIDAMARALMSDAAAAQSLEIATDAYAKTQAKADAEAIKAGSERSKLEAEWLKIRTERENEVNKTVIAGFEQIKKAQQDLTDFEDQSALSSTDFQVKKIWERVEQEKLAFKGTEQERASYNSAILTLASEQADALYAKEVESSTRTVDQLKKMTDAEAAAVLSNAQWLDYLVLKQTAAKDAQDQLTASMVRTVGVLNGQVAAAYAGYAASLDKAALSPGSLLGFSTGQLVQSTLTVPSRDVGGSGVAGQPYLIGTGAQPELFTPSTNGAFTPNAGGGAPTTINLVIDGRVLASVTSDKILQAITAGRKLS
jgi:hypothetical protein